MTALADEAASSSCAEEEPQQLVAALTASPATATLARSEAQAGMVSPSEPHAFVREGLASRIPPHTDDVANISLNVTAH